MNALTSNKVVCTRVVETGLYRDMLENLNTLDAETLNDPRSSVKNDFVQAQFSILFNVLRKANPVRGAFRQRMNAVDMMEKFRNVTESLV